MILYSMIVSYLLLISAVSILAYRNRSAREMWVSSALWSLLLALVASPGRWLFGAEGEGELLLPAPFAFAAWFVLTLFGKDNLTFSGAIYVVKSFLIPFAIVWVAFFLAILLGTIGARRRTGT